MASFGGPPFPDGHAMKIRITRDVYCHGQRLDAGTVLVVPIQDAVDLFSASAAVVETAEAPQFETPEKVTRKRKTASGKALA